LVYARGGRRSRRIHADPAVPRFDLSVFLGLYSLAIVAGIVHVKALNIAVAVVLVVAYGFYVRHHFRRDASTGEQQPDGLKPLHLGRPEALRRPDGNAPTWLAIVQTAVGLAVIVAGARVFVSSVASI